MSGARAVGTIEQRGYVVDRQSRLPSTRAIETFVTLASVGNLQATADLLGITVSAASQRISQLEDLLETKLFYRKGRKLELTTMGALYLQEVSPILKAFMVAGEKISPVSAGSTLRIASSCTFHSRWLAPLLERFRAAHPNVRFELLALDGQAASRADVALIPTTDPEATGGSHRLFDYWVTPVCTPELAREYRLMVPQDLERVTLIDLIPSLDAWTTWFRHAGLTGMKANWLTIDARSLGLESASMGVGVALCPLFLMHADGRDRLIAPFDLAVNVPGGVDVRLSGDPDRPINQHFVDWVRREAAVQNRRMNLGAGEPSRLLSS